MPILFELLSCFCQVNLGCISRIDSSRELVDIVADATKLCREFIETVDNNDVFFEDTVPNEVADEAVIAVGMFFDPFLFFSSYAKRNKIIFVLFIHSKVLSDKTIGVWA